MTEWFIKKVLAALAGITPRQWATVVQWVSNAAKDIMLQNGANRKEAVTRMIRSQWPELRDHVVNLLIEVAVAWVRRKTKTHV
jgi:hypothetical protein